MPVHVTTQYGRRPQRPQQGIDTAHFFQEIALATGSHIYHTFPRQVTRVWIEAIVDKVAPTTNPTYMLNPEEGIILHYDALTSPFAVGNIVAGAISLASADILEVVEETATSGYLVIGPVAGGPFQDGELLTDSGAVPGSADADGIDLYLCLDYMMELDILAPVAVGDTLTGVTSGSTADVAFISGGTVVLSQATLTTAFTPGEVINVGGAPVATVVDYYHPYALVPEKGLSDAPLIAYDPTIPGDRTRDEHDLFVGNRVLLKTNNGAAIFWLHGFVIPEHGGSYGYEL